MKKITKTLLLVNLLTLTILQAQDKIDISPAVAKKYDEKFSQVSTRRKGLDNNSIEDLKNPVIRELPEAPYVEPIIIPEPEPEVIEIIPEPIPEPVYVEPVREYVKYTVSGVVGNKAKINGTWYSIGEQLGDEYLRDVNTKQIVLSDKEHKNQREIKVERGLPNAQVIKK